MFARGSWAVFGVRAESQAQFEAALSDHTIAEGFSQIGVITKTKTERITTTGINPYSLPRVDETIEMGQDTTPAIVTTESLRIGPQQFGFWFIVNDYEDVTDPKSKSEGAAYELASKPFKFLNKDEKKHVETSVTASGVSSRKQFPVLVDFVGQRVYALTNSPDELGFLRQMLTQMEVETFHLAWQFENGDWPTKFLNKIQDANKFHGEMTSRAEELRRFRPTEIEKLEDKMVENVVSNYFSMSELETGQWAGLSTPAKIKLFHASEPSSEASVSTAFTLLGLSGESQVVSASVTFQHLDSKFDKKTDAEIKYRTDLFTIDINDKVNLFDAGCAALRGFDLPQFKKQMKRHAKDRGSLSIADYWMEWLIGMKTAVNFFIDNVTETLQIDKQKYGLNPYEAELETEEV